jgi:hypothetical protein
VSKAVTLVWLMAVTGLIIGTFLALLSDTSDLRDQTASLRAQVQAQARQLRADEAEQASLQSAEFRMSGQLATLTQPSDPLSSFDAVCNMPLSDQSGLTSTWYFPCTNSAQTIPQPSG